MSNMFNENTNSLEARKAFFIACDGKSKEECAEIHKEYKPISKAIFDRELELARQGWMLGY
jgi:ABC-type cobalt transport system substrate-binding protein